MTESFNMPEDLVEKLWALYQDLWEKYPDYGVSFSREQLQSLICSIYQASLTTDEGRKITFQVHFPKYIDRLTIKFDPSIPCSAHQLIKLAPTIGIGNRWIMVFPKGDNSDDFNIIGVCDPEITRGNGAQQNRWGDGLVVKSQNLPGINFSVFGPGQIRIATDTNQTLELHNCRVFNPEPFHAAVTIQRLFAEITDLLISKLNMTMDPAYIGAIFRQFWSSVIRRTVEDRHGGCFIFVPVEDLLYDPLINPKYKLKSNYLHEAFSNRSTLYPWITEIYPSNSNVLDSEKIWNLCDAHYIERDFARACSLLASMAQVDGAVIIRKDLIVECFGAELLQGNQPESDESCVFWTVQESRITSEKISSMGMRHRSAYRFCKTIPGSFAFVISQDGGIRIFCGQGDSRVKAYKDLSADEWFIP